MSPTFRLMWDKDGKIENVAAGAFRDVNRMASGFFTWARSRNIRVAECALPDHPQFDFLSPWLSFERRIEEAAASKKGSESARKRNVQAICGEFRRRAEGYLEAWRNKLERVKENAA